MRAVLACLVIIVGQAVFSAEPEPELTELRTLGARRDDPRVASQMEALLNVALKRQPGSYTLWVEDCLLQVWLGDSASHRGVKKQLARQARRSADRALALDPEGSAAHYCAAISVGQYALAVGILSALKEGLLGNFNQHIDFALAHDPDLRWGSPLLVKGRYFAEIPWPMRDLEASEALYRQVIGRHPENLRVYLFQADSLARAGRYPEAVSTLDRALTASVDYDPPEGRRVQALARMLRQELERKMK